MHLNLKHVVFWRGAAWITVITVTLCDKNVIVAIFLSTFLEYPIQTHKSKDTAAKIVQEKDKSNKIHDID